MGKFCAQLRCHDAGSPRNDNTMARVMSVRVHGARFCARLKPRQVVYRLQVRRLSSKPAKKMCVQELLGEKGKQEHRFCLSMCCSSHTTPTKKQRDKQRKNKMELTVRTFGKRQYAIEVGEDDTTEKLREKVASATGLCEDDFHMEFGGEEVEDITQLSAGDTVVLTEAKAKKYEAIAALHALGERDITAGRLRVVRDVEVATLLLQAEVATAITNDFFANSAVTSIDFSNVSVVDVIRKGFLRHCTSLTAVDLSGLSALTRIEDNFLYSCSALTTANLTGLRAVTTIGKCFMQHCTALTTVDLSSLRSVTTIGEYCLSDCTALTAVYLSGLSALTRIEDGFLFSCSALTTVNLTGLRAVTTIGARFMQRCTALTAADLSSLRSVTTIGEWCLADCRALTAVDLSGLSALTRIDYSFLFPCTALTTVNLTGLRAVTRIGPGFMKKCRNLKTVRGLGTCSYVVLYHVPWHGASCLCTAASLLLVCSVYCAHNAVKGYLYVNSLD